MDKYTLGKIEGMLEASRIYLSNIAAFLHEFPVTKYRRPLEAEIAEARGALAAISDEVYRGYLKLRPTPKDEQKVIRERVAARAPYRPRAKLRRELMAGRDIYKYGAGQLEGMNLAFGSQLGELLAVLQEVFPQRKRREYCTKQIAVALAALLHMSLPVYEDHPLLDRFLQATKDMAKHKRRLRAKKRKLKRRAA